TVRGMDWWRLSGGMLPPLHVSWRLRPNSAKGAICMPPQAALCAFAREMHRHIPLPGPAAHGKDFASHVRDEFLSRVTLRRASIGIAQTSRAASYVAAAARFHRGGTFEEHSSPRVLFAQGEFYETSES